MPSGPIVSGPRSKHDLVHQIGLQQRCRDRRPAFDHQPRDALAASEPQGGGKVEPCASACAPDNVDAVSRQRALLVPGSRVRRRNDPDRLSRALFARRARQREAADRGRARRGPANAPPCRAGGRSAADRRTAAVPMPIRIASCIARIRCTRSRAASPVIATGLRPARPALPSADTASFSVTCGRPSRMRRICPALSRARLLGADADLDRDAGRAQPRMALPRHFRIGILERGDDARDAGRDDRVRARRRLAVMRTRLERDVERRAARRAAGAHERLGLRMRPAAGLRPAPPDDDRRPSTDDRADRRIGPGLAEPAPAERSASDMKRSSSARAVMHSLARRRGRLAVLLARQFGERVLEILGSRKLR